MVLRVIKDSDDDSDALSPVRSTSTEVKGPIGTQEVDGSESTDPVLFQEVYEKHRATISTSANKYPTLEDPIINQRMSSSPLPSGGRLKRSKSLHILLTSVTEPTVSDRANRTKTSNIEDLTQLTSPSNPKDIWDVPSSVASDIISSGVKSHNAGKIDIAKMPNTYGKNKRSKSVAPRSSNLDAWKDQFASSPETSKRPAPDNPDSPTRVKRQKLYATQSSDIYGISFDGDPLNGVCNTSVESSVKVHVPHSTSDQSRQNIGSQKKFGSSIATGTQSLPAIAETPLGNKTMPENSYVVQTTEKATSSISVVPNILTPSQRFQYPEYHLEPNSSDMSHFSNVGDQLQTERSGPRELDTTATSTKPEDVPQIVSPDLSTEINKALKEGSQTPSIPPTSSRPSVTRKHKARSKTEVSRSHRDSSYDELSLGKNNTLSKVTNGKSAAGKNGPKYDERVNADELFGLDEIGLSHELYRPRPSSRRTKSVGLTEAEVSADLDRLLSSIPRAKRRSGKMSRKTQEVEDSIIVATTSLEKHAINENDREIMPVELSKPLANVEKQDEADTQSDANMGKNSMREDTADAENLDKPPIATAPKRARSKKVVREDNTEIMETPIAIQEDSEHTPKESDIISSVAPEPRGRPKKSKSAITEVKETQEADSTENTHHNVRQPSPELGGRKYMGTVDGAVSDDIIGNTKSEVEKNRREQNVSSERNDNFYSTPAATPTKPTVTEPLKTPTKEIMKKGPDQHSPLRRDEVGYRVGLSKKRKIAPLLKVIRK